MDRPVIKPLPPVPAFTVREATVCEANKSAARLGFAQGTVLPASFFDGEDRTRELTVNGSVYVLRWTETEGCRSCRLAPKAEAPKPPAVTLATLNRASGAVRGALQELLTALDGLSDHLDLDDPAVSRRGSAALRSVYRLERTAVHMSLFRMLLSGQYPLRRKHTDLSEKLAHLLEEAEDLLRSRQIRLDAQLPERTICCILDWDLVSFIIWELLENAVGEAGSDVSLSVVRRDRRHLIITVQNLPGKPLPEHLQNRWAQEPETPDELGKTGMGLSLVDAAVKCHGGRLLLSADEKGMLTAMACIRLPDREDPALSHRPASPMTSLDLGLTVLSPRLPDEVFDLLDL